MPRFKITVEKWAETIVEADSIDEAMDMYEAGELDLDLEFEDECSAEQLKD